MVVFTGVMLNELSVQIASNIGVKAGVGSTVTVTLNVAPAQPPIEGVTTYETLIGAFVLFVNVPPIEAKPVPDVVPEIPVTTGAAQEYVVPVGITLLPPDAGVTAKVPAEQIVVDSLLITGRGLTVTTNVNGVPTQVPLVGVTI